jgi:hypothetical protein
MAALTEWSATLPEAEDLIIEIMYLDLGTVPPAVAE